MSCRAPLGWCSPFLAAALLALLAGGADAARTRPVPGPLPPLAGRDRWLVDTAGRVVFLHGVNDVEKSAPYYPAARGFGGDDVALLVAEGFNALRRGVDMRGLMPLPGQVDDTYVEHLAETVTLCAQHGIFVLLDFHQDGYAPKYNGNGFPDWMAIDDGLPNPPDAVFPLYYAQNPAMQRAFEHFWANTPIPGGAGLQDYFFQAVTRVVARFATEPMVLGTELMNEPWPGATWSPCVANAAGCPDLEHQDLVPFYERGLSALRAIAPEQLVFVEPFVLFNFGLASTTIPGTRPGVALSFHSYALDVAHEEAVARLGTEAAERDREPVVVTEFGATVDTATLRRLAGQFDDRLLPWMFWAYQVIVPDQERPLTAEAIVSQELLGTLVRPYPMAITGVPTRIAFHPDTSTFELEYTTRRLGGGHFPRRLDTVVFVPARHYPDGY